MNVVRFAVEHHHLGANLFVALAWTLQSGALYLHSDILSTIRLAAMAIRVDLESGLGRARADAATPVELLQQFMSSHARALDDIPRIRFLRLCVLRQ